MIVINYWTTNPANRNEWKLFKKSLLHIESTLMRDPLEMKISPCKVRKHYEILDLVWCLLRLKEVATATRFKRLSASESALDPTQQKIEIKSQRVRILRSGNFVLRAQNRFSVGFGPGSGKCHVFLVELWADFLVQLRPLMFKVPPENFYICQIHYEILLHERLHGNWNWIH